MLSEFDQAFAEFERNAYSKLYEYYFDADKEPKNFNNQSKAQSLAEDIGYFCIIVRDLYLEALKQVSSKMDRQALGSTLEKNDTDREPAMISLGKLGASFKSFYFLIRAYHDALYKVILGLKENDVGDNSGMMGAVDIENYTLKEKNPVGEFLAGCYKEYPEWFISMRVRRNLSKYGVGISYQMGKDFIKDETTLSIRIGNPIIKQSPPLSLDEFTKALSVSTVITSAAIQYGIDKGRFISPKPSFKRDG